jgi:hypothetical protein
MLSRPVKTEVQTLIQSAVNELVGCDCLRPTIPSVPIICLQLYMYMYSIEYPRPSAPWSSELQPACQCVVQCCAIVRTSGAGAYCTRVLRTRQGIVIKARPSTAAWPGAVPQLRSIDGGGIAMAVA